MWFFGKDKLKIPHRESVAIRMEAIGGQGANSAGKILAEAAVLEEQYTGNHFSSFGSEKRGTPVRSYVRFSTVHQPVRSTSHIRQPQLLVIFHEYLIASHPEIFEGVDSNTDVLINSRKDPQALQLPRDVHPRWLGTLDATRIAHQTGSGLNTVMLGAIASFLPEVRRFTFEIVISRFFVRISESEKKSNLAGFKAGFDSLQVKEPLPYQNRLVTESKLNLHIGYENAPIGGVIVNPGNTVLKDHEASRKGFAPRLQTDLCCHCGYCDQVCPDFCFVWKKNPTMKQGAQLLGIDYQFCKGCQKCIEICPVDALTLVPESKIPDAEKISWKDHQHEK